MNLQHAKARELRNNMTKQERKIWSILKNRQFYGYRFLRQYPIGNYIVDFVCRSKKIIIEIKNKLGEFIEKDAGDIIRKYMLDRINRMEEVLNGKVY